MYAHMKKEIRKNDKHDNVHFIRKRNINVVRIINGKFDAV